MNKYPDGMRSFRLYFPFGSQPNEFIVHQTVPSVMGNLCHHPFLLN